MFFPRLSVDLVLKKINFVVEETQNVIKQKIIFGTYICMDKKLIFLNFQTDIKHLKNSFF